MILLEKATAEKNYATYLAEAADTEETVLAATKAGDIVLFKKEDTIEKKMHVGDSFFQLATSCDGDGGGTEYTNIVYNEDNTVTLTDKDGVAHTMSCTYEVGKLVDVTYDGKAVELTYNGDVLTTVGKTVVNMVNAPMTSGGTPQGISKAIVHTLDEALKTTVTIVKN